MKKKCNVLKLLVFSLLVMAFTSCSKDGLEGPVGLQGERGEIGEAGEQGPKGDNGNVNVKKFRFRIEKEGWTHTAHYGGYNNHTVFVVDASLTGGIDLRFNDDYIALVYVQPDGEYYVKKQIPYIFGIDNNYGIKFEYLPDQRYLLISKTTNGWDNIFLPVAERPDYVDVDIFLIEVNLMNELQGKFDSSNFEAVSTYFNLN